MTGTELRKKRAGGRIPGHAVCMRAGIWRSRLSDIENERVTATQGELRRIAAALDEIIAERRRISELVASEGLSLTAVGF